MAQGEAAAGFIHYITLLDNMTYCRICSTVATVLLFVT